MEGLAIGWRAGKERARLLGEVRQPSSAALAGTVLSIVALTAMRASGHGSGVPNDLFEVVLVVSFVALAILDIRRATLVALFELALAGASGRWAEFPGGVSGRIFLDAVVVARGAAGLALDAWRGDRRVLGRYGAHAILLAVALPVVWMGVGAAEGNAHSDVWNDGNGLVFFAFALVLVLLVRQGAAAWLRSAFFAACVATALLTGLLFALAASNAIPIDRLRTVLESRLDMGGGLGHMPNGAFRLYLASGLYLQVGVALVLWRLLRSPRSPWLWALNVLFWVDLYATYTRGLWLGAVLAAVIMLLLSASSIRRAAVLAAATSLVLAVAVGAAAAGGVSLPSYLASRVKSITKTDTSYVSRPASALENGSFEKPGGWTTIAAARGTLVAREVTAEAIAGKRSIELVNRSGGADAYVSQGVLLEPHRLLRFSAAVNAEGLRAPAAAERGLLVWDVPGGYVYRAPLGEASHGWRRLSVVFASGSSAGDFQFRLYAPEGTVYWDDVRLQDLGTPIGPELRLPAVPNLAGAGTILGNPGFESGSRWSLHRGSGSSSIGYSRSARDPASGRYAARLTNTRASRDDFLFQNVRARPRHLYTVSAAVDAASLKGTAAGNRGLLVWDAVNGVTWSAPLTNPTQGWTRLSVTFVSGSARGPLQIRLYSPRGVVRWDAVRIADRGGAGDPPVPATSRIPPSPLSSSSVDTAGEISNSVKVEQAKVLWRHIERRPILGYGFGAIALDYPFSRSYSYELTYLDLLFKTGFVGLLLYLSFPARMIRDALRGRFGRLELAEGVSRHEVAVVVAIVASVLVAGATNPYLLAAFGLFPLVISIAWLQPREDGRH